MSIKKLYKDIFEHVDFLDKEVTNPFLKTDENDKNPFAKFYGGTYVWIEKNDNKTEK